MEKFGLEPVGSLARFGVSGALGRKAEILYFPFFDTRSLGRVSDLWVAQLRPSGIDEVALRDLINLSILSAYSAQVFDPVDALKPLGEPIYAECGIDLEKLVFGVSFRLSPALGVQWPGLADRVFSGNFNSEFEAKLIRLQARAHRMILKYVPENGLAELMLFLGLPGRISEDVLKKKVPMDVVLLEPVSLTESSGEEKYTDFGDLNYRKLLESDQRQRSYHPKKREFRLPDLSSWKWAKWLGGNAVEQGADDPEKLTQLLALKTKRIEEMEVEIKALKNMEASKSLRNGPHSSPAVGDRSSALADYAVLRVQCEHLEKTVEELKAKNLELVSQVKSRS